MKVLMLGWELPPYTSGGLGQACHFLAQELASRDYDIDFFVLEPQDDYAANSFMKVISATNARLENIDKPSPYDSSYWLLVGDDGKHNAVGTMAELVELYTRGVLEAMKNCEYDIDIIHAHDWLTAKAAMELKRILNKPMAIHIHATEYDRAAAKGGNGFVADIEKAVIDDADVIFPVSHYTGNVIEKIYGADHNKIMVAHNGPISSLSEMTGVVAEHEGILEYLENLRGRGYRVLLSLGRLTIQKNLYNMFHAIAKVVEVNPKTIVVISGSGEQRDELMELAAELGISKNLLWVGFTRGDYKHRLYELSDIFLMPSASEPFGLTPLEALEANTPTILSKTSGVWEVIPSFIAVDAWDIDRMAHEILFMLNDEEHRQAVLAACKAELAKHSWSVAADVVEAGYKKVLGL